MEGPHDILAGARIDAGLYADARVGVGDESVGHQRVGLSVQVADWDRRTLFGGQRDDAALCAARYCSGEVQPRCLGRSAWDDDRLARLALTVAVVDRVVHLSHATLV